MKALHKMRIASAVCLMGISMAQANIVSWNYDNNSTVGGDGAGSLPALTATAGVVDAGGWINTWPDNQTTDLRDDTGNATTIDISWASANSWSMGGHPGQDTDLTWNKEMLNGYLNSGVAGWTAQSNSVVTLDQIVDDGVAGYDIYVYFSSDAAGRTGTISDGTTTYYFNTLGPASVTDASGNAVFAQATSTDTNGYAVAANYAVFSGLTGSSQTIDCFIPDWAGISGIQVVGVVPEPATMGLVGIFGAGVLFVRRRMKM